MDQRQILAQLLMQGQGQGMGPGNDVPRYLDNRADAYGEKTDKALQGAGAYGIGSLALGGLTTPGSLGMGALGVNELIKALLANGRMNRAENGADMWANRFGEGQPAQGMPGTPSGPAWRR